MKKAGLLLVLKVIDLALYGYSAIARLKSLRVEIVALQAAGEQVTDEQMASLDASIDGKLEELKRLVGG